MTFAPSRPTAASSPATAPVVVVGAGISGVACARQLEYLLSHFASNFAPAQPPSVILLEARGRIGGRIHSHELVAQHRFLSSCPSTLTPPPDNGPAGAFDIGRPSKVDLGAQIITGFENGNPMDVIVRRQLGLPVQPLVTASLCFLHDADGSVVAETVDREAEDIFNEILDRACSTKLYQPPSSSGTPTDAAQDATNPVNGDDITTKNVVLPKHLPKRLIRKILKSNALDDLENRDDRSPHDEESLEDWEDATGLYPSLGDTMDYFLETHPKYKDLSVRDLKLIHWHYANLEFANATKLDTLSLHHWDQDDEFEFRGYHHMVMGGYGQVPHAIAYGASNSHVAMPPATSVGALRDHVSEQNLLSRPVRPENLNSALDVRLSCPVKTIDWKDSEILVICRDDSEIRARAVVLTAPLGVLKADPNDGGIAFNPPLPTWKRSCIERLGFGLLNKVVLVFPYVFWDPKADMFGNLSDPANFDPTLAGKSYSPDAFAETRGEYYMFWNILATTGLPCLVAFIAGKSSYTMEERTEETLTNRAMEILRKIYPLACPLPDPVEVVVTRWGQDEFARGSYSYVGIGATGEDYDLLAKPVDGRLFFAGEATCRNYPATVHGAYLSGTHAATLLLDQLIGKQQLGLDGDEIFGQMASSAASPSSTNVGETPVNGFKKKRGRPRKTKTDDEGGLATSTKKARKKQMPATPPSSDPIVLLFGPEPRRPHLNPFFKYVKANAPRVKEFLASLPPPTETEPVPDSRTYLASEWAAISKEEKVHWENLCKEELKEYEVAANRYREQVLEYKRLHPEIEERTNSSLFSAVGSSPTKGLNQQSPTRRFAVPGRPRTARAKFYHNMELDQESSASETEDEEESFTTTGREIGSSEDEDTDFEGERQQTIGTKPDDDNGSATTTKKRQIKQPATGKRKKLKKEKEKEDPNDPIVLQFGPKPKKPHLNRYFKFVNANMARAKEFLASIVPSSETEPVPDIRAYLASQWAASSKEEQMRYEGICKEEMRKYKVAAERYREQVAEYRRLHPETAETPSTSSSLSTPVSLPAKETDEHSPTKRIAFPGRANTTRTAGNHITEPEQDPRTNGTKGKEELLTTTSTSEFQYFDDKGSESETY